MEEDGSPPHWPKRMRPSTRSVELDTLFGITNDPTIPEPKRQAAKEEIQRRSAANDEKDKKSAKKDDK